MLTPIENEHNLTKPFRASELLSACKGYQEYIIMLTLNHARLISDLNGNGFASWKVTTVQLKCTAPPTILDIYAYMNRRIMESTSLEYAKEGFSLNISHHPW